VETRLRARFAHTTSARLVRLFKLSQLVSAPKFIRPAVQPTQQDLSSGAAWLLMTVIIWGLQFPVAKHAFETVNAFHSAVLRFSVPAVILLTLLVIKESFGSLLTRKDTWPVAGLGVLGMSATPSLIFGGLMFTRPEIAAIIVATQPLMTVIAQRLLGGDNPSLISLACVAFAFLGVVTVVTRWEATVGLSGLELMGDVMVLMGAFGWVMFTIASTRYRHWSSLRFTALTMTAGTLANTLLVIILVAIGLYSHPSLDEWYQVRWEMLFLALIGVLGAMYGWNAGARRVGPLNAMLFINLIPVVTFIVRYWQGYRFENIELIGAGMVIVALLVQNVHLRLRAREHA